MNPAEEIPPAVAHRAYYRQPVWKRIFVIGAGPAVNIVLAFLILWALSGRTASTSRQGEISRATTPPALGVLRRATGSCRSTACAGTSRRCASRSPPTSAPASRDGCKAATPATIVVLARRRGADGRAGAGLQRRAGRHVRRLRGRHHAPATVGPGEAADVGHRDVALHHATISTIAGVFEAEKRKQISGVVGSYEETRKSLRAERRAGDLPAGRSSPCRSASSTCSRSCRSTAATSSGRWPRRSAAGAIPFSVMERAGFVGFVLVIALFMIGLDERRRTD